MKGCGLTIQNQGSNTSPHLLCSFGGGIQKQKKTSFFFFFYIYLILPVYPFFLRVEVFFSLLLYLFSCFNELYDQPQVFLGYQLSFSFFFSQIPLL